MLSMPSDCAQSLLLNTAIMRTIFLPPSSLYSASLPHLLPRSPSRIFFFLSSYFPYKLYPNLLCTHSLSDFLLFWSEIFKYLAFRKLMTVPEVPLRSALLRRSQFEHLQTEVESLTELLSSMPHRHLFFLIVLYHSELCTLRSCCSSSSPSFQNPN